MFLNQNCLFRLNNSLFCFVGNLVETLWICLGVSSENLAKCADWTKFLVHFHVSREFGGRDAFACDCVRHHALPFSVPLPGLPWLSQFPVECVAKRQWRLPSKAWDFLRRAAHNAAVSCRIVRLGTAVRKMICKVFRQNTCGAIDMIIDYASVVRGSWCQMPINCCCIDCCWLIVDSVVF